MDHGRPNGRPLGRLWVPVALAHVVCCGGLILWLLLGSAGVAAVGSSLGDPLFQALGLLLLGSGGLAAWRHHRRRKEAPMLGLGRASIPSQSSGDGGPQDSHSTGRQGEQ